MARLPTPRAGAPLMADLLWLDGAFLPAESGRVSFEDRGFQFADGIYEVVACFDGEPFMIEEHLDRFDASAAGLLIDPDYSRDARREVILELAHRSPARDTMIYGQLTRGAAPRSHVFPAAHVHPTELWHARPLPTYPPEYHQKGVGLISHPDERWANCHLKTISLLPNILAKEKAKRAGCFEALFYNTEGIVTECGASNAWAVVDGEIRTHPLTHAILGGITRILILELARELNLRVNETAATLDVFRCAEEVFLSSTTVGALPVAGIDGRPVGSGTPGPITRALMAALDERIASVRAGMGART